MQIIRYTSYNTSSLMLKVSRNQKNVFFCTDSEYFIKNLETGKQKKLDFLSGTRVRKIFHY